MSDEHLAQAAEGLIDEMVGYENHELKGFHKTIAEDIKELLVESNPTLLLNNSPELVLIMVSNIYSSDPCSSCSENLSNVSEWLEKNNHFDNEVRVLLVDALNGFDSKKVWEKLKVSFDDVPLTLFFNSQLGLIDVVQGVMSVNYLEMFWSGHFD